MSGELRTADAGLSFARRWAAAAVLSASLLVIVMDLTILNIAVPELATDLKPSATELLWIVDVYSLVLAGLLVPASAIADRWGRKRMLLTGYAVFGSASVLVLLADTPEAVIAVRALLGVGGAMIMPTTLSMLRTVFTDPTERATALAVWASVAGIGAAVGPLVGGVLLENFSWHSAFLVNVPLMVVALGAGFLILPESRSSKPGRWDPLSAALSLVGMATLVWSIKQFAKAQSLGSVEAWVTLLVALVLLAWFARRCLRSDSPMIDLRLFERPQFTAGILAALGAMFTLAAALLLLAQWMQLVEGQSPIETGVRLLPSALVGAAASLAAPWFARRFGVRAVLGGALLLAGIGMILIFAVPGELTYPTVFVALSLLGAGTGALALASAMIMAGTPEAKAGNAAALEEVSYDLGNVLGVAVLGSLAAVVFRSGLKATDALDGLTPDAAKAATESLGNAVAVVESTGSADLARAAAEEFTHALQLTSLVGGLTLTAVAVVVILVTPRRVDITEQHH